MRTAKGRTRKQQVTKLAFLVPIQWYRFSVMESRTRPRNVQSPSPPHPPRPHPFRASEQKHVSVSTSQSLGRAHPHARGGRHTALLAPMGKSALEIGECGGGVNRLASLLRLHDAGPPGTGRSWGWSSTQPGSSHGEHSGGWDRWRSRSDLFS